MKRTRARLLALALCAAVCLSLLPGAAVAAEEDTFTDGAFTCKILTEPTDGAPGTVQVAAIQLNGGTSGKVTVEIPETLTSNDKPYTVTQVGDGTNSVAKTNFFVVGAIHLPDTVTAINDHAFERFNQLREVTGAAGLQRIGARAFYQCAKLETINLPEGLEVIGDQAFFRCTNLALDSLPDSVEAIGANAFSRCNAISLTTLPSSLTRLGEYAFEDCGGIRSLTIGAEGLKVIPKYAFAGSGLERLVIGGGVTEISPNAFQACSIQVIDLSATLRTIGQFAFHSDGGVPGRTFYLRGEAAPDFGGNCFFNGSSGQPQVFYVPKGHAESYRQALNSFGTVHDGFPETISLANIPGVTPPVAGQFPVERIQETGQYDGTVAWSPELSASGAFRPSTAYTATVTLTPKIGWKLDQIAADFFRVAGANPVTNAAGGSVVTAVFPATGGAAQTIDVPDIPSLTPPQRGWPPVRTVETNQYTGTVAWDPAVAENGVFAADQVYTARIVLIPKSGYTLDGVAENTFRVAGAASVTHTANSGAVTAVFPPTLSVPTDTVLDVTGITQGTQAEIEARIDAALLEQNLFENEVTGLELSGDTAGLEGWPWVIGRYGPNSPFTSLAHLDLSGLTKLTSMAPGDQLQAPIRLTTLVLPAGLDSYPADAFRGCFNLKLIRLERQSAPAFGADTFRDCAKAVLSLPQGAQGNWDAAGIPWADGAALSGLTVDGYGLIPAFSPRTATYRVAAGADAGQLTLNLAPLRPEDAVTVNGQAVITGAPIVVSMIDGKVTVTVTAADPADARTYTITPVDDMPLDVTYDGGSLDAALKAALTQAGMTAGHVTTLRLSGTAQVITGAEWAALRGLFPSEVSSTDWTALSQVDLGGMTALKEIGAGEDVPPDITQWTKVVLPEGLERIGKNAFRHCLSLTADTQGAGPARAARTPNALPETVSFIGASAFARCQTLALAALPAGLREVEESAFEDCEAVTVTALPQGLERVGVAAFLGSGIGAGGLTIPASLTHIGVAAFAGTASLTGFQVAAGNPAYASREGVLFDAGFTTLIAYSASGTATRYTVPDTVTTLAAAAFLGCFHLEEILLPQGLTTIGAGTFAACEGLKRITIPAGVTTLADTKGIPEDEDMEGTFSGCLALEELRFEGAVCPALGEELLDRCPKTLALIYPEGGTGYEALLALAEAAEVIAPSVAQVTLEALAITPGTLSPAFGGGIQDYVATVPYGTKSVTLTPTPRREGDTVQVNGADPKEPVTLAEEGETVISVTVTKEGAPANTRTYTITVTWEPAQGGGGGGVSTYSITPKAGEGGTMDPAKRVSVRRGKDQTFTITPAEGYVIADVLVDGKSVGAVETYTFEKVKARHTIEALFAPKPAWENPFTDVAEDDWFYGNVAWAHQSGVMTGTAADTFAPNAPVTRAMAVTTLYRLAGNPQDGGEGAPFTDVPDGAWYAGAVRWAVGAGVTRGVGDGRFDPDGTVTRAQLFTLLHRFAQYQKRDVSAGEDSNILSFTDATALAEWSVPAFQWACGAGLVEGTEDGRLAPEEVASRAQLAAVLERYAGDGGLG